MEDPHGLRQMIREAKMKIRSVVARAGLTISFALSTFAQQRDVVADPQIIQKIPPAAL
jgi:hypothetical protein